MVRLGVAGGDEAWLGGAWRGVVRWGVARAGLGWPGRGRVEHLRWIDGISLCCPRTTTHRHAPPRTATHRHALPRTATTQALYRRAVARMALKDFAEARRDLFTAAKLEPSNREVRKHAVRASGGVV